MTQPLPQQMLRLWRHISHRRQGQFAILIVLMILAAFSEIISIGAVIPFLAILTNPTNVLEHPSLQIVIQSMGIEDATQLLMPITITFGFAALLAGTMRLLLLWASTRLSYAAGADISFDIYRRTLYQPYAVHVARNSSEIIDGISSKTNNAVYVINMMLNLISSSVILVAILIALLSVDPVIAMAAFGGFGFIYVLIIQLNRKRVLTHGQTIAIESSRVIKSLQEGLGGIRDVLIDGSQSTYCQIYSNADLPLRRAQGAVSFISYAPRYGMEALGMILIASLAYVLVQQENGISKAIPVLGAFALGAQRLLPVLQQAYGSWSGIQGGLPSLQVTLELLSQPLPDFVEQPSSKVLQFKNQIELQNISFRYSLKTPWVLNDLNLKITKGSRVGFVGVTGSGKSTLLDILMGLLQPSSGNIFVDGQPIKDINIRSWQAHIAHVPQTIFLTDSTIEENIAFGVPKVNIDHSRVQQVAEQAQIATLIEAWPLKYQTLVGERGVRLSGGQRQRIGIARALYKQADVIIFDEATSALDNETEQSVMNAIEGLSHELTILIIAHRLTTLKNCTHVVEVGSGGIKQIGSYQEIVKQIV